MSARTIRTVGDTPIRAVHRASCHCGAVELEVKLPRGIVDPHRCNCSLCRRKGAVVATVPLPDLRVVRGGEHLSLYQFHTRTAKHYFCAICGVYTHHQRRSDPGEYGLNVGCLQDVDPLAIDPVPVSDGVHHPSDSIPSDSVPPESTPSESIPADRGRAPGRTGP